MTPAARYAAAIEVLDDIVAGNPAERCLTNWARGHRFAGSKDRAAIRDHVYDVLRAKRSLGVLGGGASGRALVLGLLRRDGIDPDQVFGAGGYGPDALSGDERDHLQTQPTMSQADHWNIPDGLMQVWTDSLGTKAEDVALMQAARAPVFLRVNLRRITRDGAQALLAKDAISTVAHDTVATALVVTENPRRVKTCQTYLDGLVELQDASSQAAMLVLDIAQGARVLDYCAGGGGKALALADMYNVAVTAHDIDPKRMADIPARAQRARVKVNCVTARELADLPSFDVVLCDAPCSGSGTWRRTPEAKWDMDEEKLLYFNKLQRDVLGQGAKSMRKGGMLAYATCSVFTSENDAIVDDFLQNHPGWTAKKRFQTTPSGSGDGFYLTTLQSTVDWLP